MSAFTVGPLQSKTSDNFTTYIALPAPCGVVGFSSCCATMYRCIRSSLLLQWLKGAIVNPPSTTKPLYSAFLFGLIKSHAAISCDLLISFDADCTCCCLLSFINFDQLLRLLAENHHDQRLNNQLFESTYESPRCSPYRPVFTFVIPLQRPPNLL